MITVEVAMLYMKLQCVSSSVSAPRETTVAMCPAREVQGPTLPAGWKPAEPVKPAAKKVTKKKKFKKHKKRKYKHRRRK